MLRCGQRPGQGKYMREEKNKGLLLQTIPYLGSSRILKVFTREAGLISLFTKTKNLGSLGSPFCIGEWIYKGGKGDIYTLQDASLIDPLLDLRHSFASISSAGSMAQDILRSQLPEQASPPLYDLLGGYFKKLAQFSQPEILVISFRLKLLLHEGLLSLNTQCTRCAHKALHLSRGESFCLNHSLSTGLTFTQIEWDQLHQLAFASKFSLLNELNIPPSFMEKISVFTTQIILR